MEKLSRDQIVDMYRTDIERLVCYLPWLQNKTGTDVTSYQSGDEMKKTLSFPVYDGTLLSFLNDLSTTIFMDANYRYIYTRYRMKDWKDELRCIDQADIMSMDILKGIFSKYTMGGMTKAYLWTEGMEHGIFLKALLKAKSIIEYWDVPIPVPQTDEPEEIQEMPEVNQEEPEVIQEVPEVMQEETFEEMSEEMSEGKDTVDETGKDGEFPETNAIDV